MLFLPPDLFTDEIKDFHSVIDLESEKNKDPNSIFKFLNIFEKNSLKPILDKLILKELSVDEVLILYYYYESPFTQLITVEFIK